MLVWRWRARGSLLLGPGTVASAEAVQVNDRRRCARVVGLKERVVLGR